MLAKEGLENVVNFTRPGSIAYPAARVGHIGVLFGWFGEQIEGPGSPGGSVIYQGHRFSKKDTYDWAGQVHTPALPKPLGGAWYVFAIVVHTLAEMSSTSRLRVGGMD